MKIKEVTWQHRNDFHAILEREHCHDVQILKTGYNDEYYHNRVLPAITCIHCDKNRFGEIPEQKNYNGLVSV